mgnify:CR=1 FL=1
MPTFGYSPGDPIRPSDDQSGIGANASITHTATTTGTYYIAADSASLAGQGTYKLTLTLLNDNNAPVANDDTGVVRVGGSVKINVGLNDTDPDEDPLFTSLESVPSQGSITFIDNTNFYDFLPIDLMQMLSVQTRSPTKSVMEMAD